jgi:tRNA G18 (ribose-2'-O)-methylase SpoU
MAKPNPMVNYAEINRETLSSNFNVQDKYKDNTYEENVAICRMEKNPFSVAAVSVTGELNIGMMIRSACLMGAENFYIIGRKRFDKRSTVGAENYINIVQMVVDPLNEEQEIVDFLLKMPHNVILCEHGGHSLGRNNGEFYAKNYRPLFVFGSESHGLPQKILDEPTFSRISIPQFGVLRSYNVSAAMNIICWDYLKEMKV